MVPVFQKDHSCRDSATKIEQIPFLKKDVEMDRNLKWFGGFNQHLYSLVNRKCLL